MSVLMYEAHTRPHPCFRMITWQLLSRMMIAMDIIIYIDSIYCCNHINIPTFTYAVLLVNCCSKHQCTDSPMHGFTNAQIHQCTDSPMHRFTNARIHQCTDSPMHYALCTMQGFTNAQIHQCIMHYALCRDSPMHRFTNARIHQCTDSPMHYALCTMQGFTNARIHQCTDSQCTDS